jgi:hypothetical protein
VSPRCRSCNRPIAFRAKDGRLLAVEAEPVEVILGPPQQLVQAVTLDGELVSGFLDTPGRRGPAWLRHWVYKGCRA